MLTQCPGCQTVFRVTSAILRAAHGQVRCGRCNQQFDAISQLLDQDTVEADAADNTAATSSDTHADASHTADFQAVTSHPDTTPDPGFAGIGHEDIVLEGTRIEISGIYAKPINDHGESVLEQSQVIEEFNLDTEQWENPFEATGAAAARNNPQDTASAELSNTGVNALLSTSTDSASELELPADETDDSPAAQSIDAQSLADDGINSDVADITDVEDELNAVDLVRELASLEAELATNSATAAPASTAADDLTADPGSVPAHDLTADTTASTTTASDTDNKNLVNALAAASAAGQMEEIVLSTGEFENPMADVKPADELTAFLSGAADSATTEPRWPWAVAGMLALVLLAAQVLHHFRTELARHPSVGPVLVHAYTKLGMTLAPHWLVNAYTIKQWGMVSDPQQPGVLRMRASVTNVANFAQPYPLLRFTLEDRFGATVGQREFKPAEYLTSRDQANRLLPSNTAANVDLAIVDPGPDAVGFQLDSCLNEAGQVHCAHDLPTAP